MLMNYILLGSTGLTVGSIGVPAALFFVPPGSGGGGGGLPALDANGNQVTSGDWLKSHLAGDRCVVVSTSQHNEVACNCLNGTRFCTSIVTINSRS